MKHVCLSSALLAALLAPAVPAAPAEPPKVTIYRCTDAAGRLSLRDSPCRRGENQQVRSMLRPTDAPLERRRASTPSRVSLSTTAVPPRVIYVATARPVYECVAPDGSRYTSDTPEGHPRWMPAWTGGYPVVIAPGSTSGYGGRVDYRDSRGSVRLEGRRDWRMPGTVIGTPYGYAAGGAWIRDSCSALPAAEVCARLQDRRYELDRRYTSALQGDRDAIVREQRVIDSRLVQECSA